MLKTAASMLVLGAILGLSVVGAQDDAAPDAPEGASRLPFQSKIVAVTLLSDVKDLLLMTDLTEQALGDRLYLVGQGVDDGETSDWRNGKRIWIPMDDIQQIIEFESVEAFRESLESRKADDHATASSAARTPVDPATARLR
ncbi:MAG: hypothetical protein KF774_04490 [Planctomyces sp.]|nr:hypothetical protein [Planctomyces sp.]